MVQIIIFGIACILAMLNLVREIFVFLDIKSMFYCEHCHCFNEEISSISKCRQCHRSFSIKGKNWEHLLIHRVNWIPSNKSSEVLKWKEYRKLSLIEITLSTVMMIVFLLFVILKVFNII